MPYSTYTFYLRICVVFIWCYVMPVGVGIKQAMATVLRCQEYNNAPFSTTAYHLCHNLDEGGPTTYTVVDNKEINCEQYIRKGDSVIGKKTVKYKCVMVNNEPRIEQIYPEKYGDFILSCLNGYSKTDDNTDCVCDDSQGKYVEIYKNGNLFCYMDECRYLDKMMDGIEYFESSMGF